jgi:hypothetical protein
VIVLAVLVLGAGSLSSARETVAKNIGELTFPQSLLTQLSTDGGQAPSTGTSASSLCSGSWRHPDIAKIKIAAKNDAAKACASVGPGSIIEAEGKPCGPWSRTYKTLIAKSGAIV